MNLEPSLSEAEEALEAYRARARAFLAAHAPAFSGAARDGLNQAQDVALARQWQRTKAEHGFAAITLPKAYGGGGGSDLERIVFVEEEDRYRLPTEYFRISLSNPVPIMAARGTEAQKWRLLPPAIRGDELWCQLFSESAAGSDLTALRMSARREGDRWILNGQKLWTSWAHLAEWGVIIVRTDPDVPKHQGLTYFYVNMRSPGITVRPVPLLTGSTQVNEVFFDDVEVPDDQRIGAVGEGFKVALETLMIERYGKTDPWGYGPDFATIVGMLKGVRLGGRDILEDPRLIESLTDALVQEQALREISRCAFEAIEAGRAPGPEGSINKLLISTRRQSLARTVMDMIGPDALSLPPGALSQDDAATAWLGAPMSRIAGGTDQILKNTVAERILGMPQDHRPDKGVAFKDLPH